MVLVFDFYRIFIVVFFRVIRFLNVGRSTRYVDMSRNNNANRDKLKTSLILIMTWQTKTFTCNESIPKTRQIG